MKFSQLLSIARGLSPPAHSCKGETFSALPLPGQSRYHVAKDVKGLLSVLISPADSVQAPQGLPVALENLTIRPNVECIITIDGSVQGGKFTIITCLDANESVIEMFLRVMVSIAEMLGPEPKQNSLIAVIEQVVRLFRSLSGQARKTIQGLWSELLIISESSDPHMLIQSWHATPAERWDFASGNQRIEVKSTTGVVRSHYFSLDQLSPPTSTSLVIASIFVERAGGGSSAEDLSCQIRKMLPHYPESLLKLDEVVVTSLGLSWQSTIEECFDLECALDSLRYFDAHVIPSIRCSLSPQISDVRFRADLSECVTVECDELRKRGGIFSALGSRRPT